MGAPIERKPKPPVTLQTAKFLVVALRKAMKECPEIHTLVGSLYIHGHSGTEWHHIRFVSDDEVVISHKDHVIARYVNADAVD